MFSIYASYSSSSISPYQASIHTWGASSIFLVTLEFSVLFLQSSFIQHLCHDKRDVLLLERARINIIAFVWLFWGLLLLVGLATLFLQTSFFVLPCGFLLLCLIIIVAAFEPVQSPSVFVRVSHVFCHSQIQLKPQQITDRECLITDLIHFHNFENCHQNGTCDNSCIFAADWVIRMFNHSNFWVGC